MAINDIHAEEDEYLEEDEDSLYEDAPDEIIYNSDDSSAEDFKFLKAKLIRIFDSVDENSRGSFAASNKLAIAPNPGLFVHGVGPIGMPLSESDAGAIAQASHQAPFGKGEQTVVDTSFRKTWELNASQLQFRKPEWLPFIDGLKTEIAEKLGVAGGPNAMKLELYKMLLYEQGAFFNKHVE